MNDASVENGAWTGFNSRQRWTFLAVLFLVATASYVDRQLLPILLEQIKVEYTLSDKMLGALSGAPFALCYAASSLPFARAADRGNRKVWLVVAFVIWTAMTVLCGCVTSLTMLFIARMGVGVGEGGAMPVSHALIADYFPPRLRGKAFAIFTAAATFGGALAFVIGGMLAQSLGWRLTFVVVGVASLPIGLLAMLVLREPSRASGPLARDSNAGSFRSDMTALKAKQSFVLIVAGFTIYALFAYGPTQFIPAFLIRVMHLDMAKIGANLGAASVMGTLGGALVGGLLADRLARRDARWLVWWPALGFAVCLPIALLTFSASTAQGFFIGYAILLGVLYATLPSIFAAVQHVCGPSRRATATAIVMASLNAIGMTLGPFATGWISDVLQSNADPQALRHALMLVSCALGPAAMVMAMSSRTFRADAQE